MLGGNNRYSSSLVPEYLWRIVNWRQMDFHFTYSQMINLLQSPSDVYKSTKLRKEIKNQWARDDPAFVVILCGFILMASLAYSVAFGFVSFWHFIRIVLGQVFIEFLGLGCLVATVNRWLANKYMRVNRIMSVEQEVEWLYAFDIHCNSFFPLFVLLYPVQFFLSPILLQHGFVASLLANTLYAVAFGYYHYITFLGYSALPFLQNTQRFFHPVVIIGALYILALLLNVNMSTTMLSLYFGK